jgi:hypothetical protein
MRRQALDSETTIRELKVELQVRELERKKSEFFDAVSSAKKLRTVDMPMVMHNTVQPCPQTIKEDQCDMFNFASLKH